MTNSEQPGNGDRPEVTSRRTAIRRWAKYVRTHDDAEWSGQQNVPIDSQLQSATERAGSGGTDPVRCYQ